MRVICWAEVGCWVELSPKTVKFKLPSSRVEVDSCWSEQQWVIEIRRGRERGHMDFEGKEGNQKELEYVF